MNGTLLFAAGIGFSLIMADSYADCTPSQNLIGQTEVSTLRQEANDADERAAMATNPTDRVRWQEVARNFRSQADMLEQNQQTVAQAAQQACESLSGNGQ